jgi:hypothetical protein
MNSRSAEVDRFAGERQGDDSFTLIWSRRNGD